jgi:putative toxin-antitoxin system antitoxin component (TIGR02293 family)
MYVKLLGFTKQDPLALVRQVEKGLSYHRLERFQRNSMLSTQELAAVVDIPIRTLHRRREQGRLERPESDRLVRLSRIFGRALELFEGNADAARRWLSTPLRALHDERPINLVRTDVGTREIENLIGRLEHGVAS